MRRRPTRPGSRFHRAHRAACRRRACRTARACLEGEAGTSRFECLAVLDRGVGRLVEDLALAAVVRLLLGGVVDLLEHARNREDEIRLECGELVEQGRQIRGVTDSDLVIERREGDESREHVSEWQEQQCALTGFHRVGQPQLGCRGLGVEVAMFELHALGPAGGTRGVDESGGGFRVHLLAAFLDLLVGDCSAAGGELLDCAWCPGQDRSAASRARTAQPRRPHGRCRPARCSRR